MLIGNQEYRDRCAKLLRDTRRIMGRVFAKVIRDGINEMIATKFGEVITEKRFTR